MLALSAQRSQHQSQPRSLSAPALVAICLNTSPSYDPSQPQPRSVSASAPAVSTPAHPQTFQRQRQHQPSNSPNASCINTCPNGANSSCPPTISAPTPALPPTISMSAVHASGDIPRHYLDLLADLAEANCTAMRRSTA